MPSNYYMVLGIERGADLSRIKHAYRKAIKRYPPDMGGSSTDYDKFIQAREAYEVLSDLERRRAHDAQIRRAGIPVHVTRIPKAADHRRRVWRDLRHPTSTLNEFFEGLVPGLYRRRPRRNSVVNDLYMEVILTPDEARSGGVFPVAVPVQEPCPDCSGAFFCPTCGGEGTVSSRREFNLAVPPNVTDGTSVAVSLEDIGLRGARLLIDVRVGRHP